MTARWFAVIVVAAALALPAQALVQEKKEEAATDKPDKKDLPLEGSRTIAFTTDEGRWMSLDVSPDGKTIVFESAGRPLQPADLGGEAKRMTDGMAFDSQPRYSPDGSRITFLSDRSGADNVWTAKADGTDPKAITKEKTQTFRSPEWTPDGKYIIVAAGGARLR